MKEGTKSMIGNSPLLLLGVVAVVLLGAKLFFPEQMPLAKAIMFSVFGSFYLMIGALLIFSEDFCRYFYFKPMKFMSVFDIFGSNYEKGSWCIRWVYVPFFLAMGVASLLLALFFPKFE